MVLEVAIGLIFVYLLFSLFCSALSEIIAWALNLRANTLRGGIETLLKDSALPALVKENPKLQAMVAKVSTRWKQTEQDVASTLYAHPLIQGMIHDKKQPSHIPSHTFTAAFLDLLHSLAKTEASPGNGLQKLRAAIAQLPEQSEIRQQLDAVLDDSVKTFEEAHARVQGWFDDSMERVSGWYKRRAQVIVLIVATLAVGIANADSVMIVRSLAHDSALRAGLVTAAEQTAQAGPPETRTEPNVVKAAAMLQQTLTQINELRLPIGWTFDSQATIGQIPDPRRMPHAVADWVGKIAGLLFTILAVSMGAPFWFDVLNKVVNARITGAQPPPKKKQQTEAEG
ncbi:MAG: hypothetical protein ACJ8AT_10075 [Hyalangium sp.]|uniref:hypothetical protein n=1 Tax=Hyalangium sp. TaxID=2028555 RepID=UPI00389A6914